jgi:hypothetical protein
MRYAAYALADRVFYRSAVEPALLYKSLVSVNPIAAGEADESRYLAGAAGKNNGLC